MMKQEDLLKKTGAILNELQEQYEFMMQEPQQISELELELFLANANFLTEHVQILKKISNYQPVKALPEHAQPSSAADTNVAPTQVFDDFFTPDKETPTFEFIVNDRKDAPHFVAESTSQQINPEEPEEEDDDYPEKELYEIEEPEEEPYEQAPVEEPVEEPKPLNRYVHPVYSNMDISSIPPEQIAHDEPIAETEAIEEEDEVGPEPFLVSQEPETPAPAPTPIAAAVPEPVIPIFSTPTLAVEQVPAPTPAPAPKAEPAVAPAAAFEPEPVVIPEAKPFTPPASTPYDEPEAPRYTAPVVPTYTEPVTPTYTEPVAPRYTEPVAPQSSTPAASAHQPTLNELLAAGRNAGQARPEQEQARPEITDMKRAISLNEKLLFVKDLFDGYNLAYAEAIDLINKMPDFKTADAFLQKHYAGKHNWAAKQSTADQFYELLHQRFPR